MSKVAKKKSNFHCQNQGKKRTEYNYNLCLQVSHPQTQSNTADTESQLYHTILHRGLEHPIILVSKAVLETNPYEYQGTTVLHSDYCKDW